MDIRSRNETFPSWCKGLLIDKEYFLSVTLCALEGSVGLADFAFLRFCRGILEVGIVLRLCVLFLTWERGFEETAYYSIGWEDWLLEGLLRISLLTIGASFVAYLGRALEVSVNTKDIFSWGNSSVEFARQVVDRLDSFLVGLIAWSPYSSRFVEEVLCGSPSSLLWFEWHHSSLSLFLCYLGLGSTPHPAPHSRFGKDPPSFFVSLFLCYLGLGSTAHPAPPF